jgi:hypothetical protein
LCYLCFYLLSKHEACFVLHKFHNSYDDSSLKLRQGMPHSFGKNGHVKTFARAYTNHPKREPMHPLHTREMFARQIFMCHKTKDTNFILNLGEKLSVIVSYFRFSQSSCLIVTFLLHCKFHTNARFSSCILPTLLYG